MKILIKNQSVTKDLLIKTPFTVIAGDQLSLELSQADIDSFYRQGDDLHFVLGDSFDHYILASFFLAPENRLMLTDEVLSPAQLESQFVHTLVMLDPQDYSQTLLSVPASVTLVADIDMHLAIVKPALESSDIRRDGDTLIVQRDDLSLDLNVIDFFTYHSKVEVSSQFYVVSEASQLLTLFLENKSLGFAVEGVVYGHTLDFSKMIKGESGAEFKLSIDDTHLPAWLNLQKRGENSYVLVGVPEQKQLGEVTVELILSGTIGTKKIILVQAYPLSIKGKNYFSKATFISLDEHGSYIIVRYDLAIAYAVDLAEFTQAATLFVALSGIVTTAAFGAAYLKPVLDQGQEKTTKTEEQVEVLTDTEVFSGPVQFVQAASKLVAEGDVVSTKANIVDLSSQNHGPVIQSSQQAPVQLETPHQAENTVLSVIADSGGDNGSSNDILTVSLEEISVEFDQSLTQEDQFILIDVLANDTLSLPATITSVTMPANGSVFIQGTQLAYVPSPDFNGLDTFTYTVVDASGAGGTGTVQVTINPVVDIASDSVEVLQNSSVNVVVLNNDSFEGTIDASEISIASAPSIGQATIEANGTVTYVPNTDSILPDSFTYTVSQTGGTPETATVSVEVVGGILIARNDQVAIQEDAPIQINALGNDTFELPTTITNVSAPSNGSAIIQNNQIFYAPNADFNGLDSFTYTMMNTFGDSQTASVQVTINSVVDIANDSVEALQNSFVNIPVLDNDNFEAVIDPSDISISSAPSSGQAIIEADGTVTYIPNPDSILPDNFTYTVSPIGGTPETATVSVEVVGGVLIARDDQVVIQEDAPIQINALGNDTFELPTMITNVSTPSNGGAIIQNNQIFYSPNADFNGLDSFTYTMTNTFGDSETATVQVTINSVVDIANDSAEVLQNSFVKIDVLANDSFENMVNASDITITRAPSNGQAVVEADNTITYTPNPDSIIPDNFSYTVSSVGGTPETASVSIQVVGGALIAQGDQVLTQEDMPVLINALGNDTFELPTMITNVSTPSSGSAIIQNNQIFYTPDSDFHGMDDFTYTITNTFGDSQTAIVQVVMEPVVDIMEDTASVLEGSSVNIDVLANDTFESTIDPSEVSIIVAPTDGQVVVEADGTITYTPDMGYTGPDVFTYQVSPATGIAEQAPVIIDVIPTPLIASDQVITYPLTADSQQGEFMVTVAPSDPVELDITGADLGTVIEVLVGPSHGTLQFSGSGPFQVVYTPDTQFFFGTDTFVYRVNDGAVSDAAIVGITPMVITTDPNFELTIGTDSNDTILISGGGQNIAIYAGAGDDTIASSGASSSANSILNGGEGNDMVSGGSNKDIFVWTAKENLGNQDFYDGLVGDDTVRIDLTGLQLTSDEWGDLSAQLDALQTNLDNNAGNFIVDTPNLFLSLNSIETVEIIGEKQVIINDDAATTGTAGNDVFLYSGDPLNPTTIDGLAGSDTLKFIGDNLNLNLTDVNTSLDLANIERIDLTGSGDNTLTLDLDDIFDMTDGSNVFLVDGDIGDAVSITNVEDHDFEFNGLDQAIAGHTAITVTAPQGVGTIYVSSDVSVMGI